MTAQHAFYFDAAYCSGCKACQAACKDKNHLPVGVLWRRVYEISGGTWQQNGEAWHNTVFTYNLSMSCNHCVHPKCAGVCPVDAYLIREDGIVILDSAKCIGCGYCIWACTYSAPQYNPEAGFMTKCDFCFDNLEQGLPPVCVSACPMRVLDYGEAQIDSSVTSRLALWEVPAEKHPYPLPNNSHTQPRLAIKPHSAMYTTKNKFVANLEEIQPRTPSNWEEVPLLLFTLFSQMAIGGMWATAWMFPLLAGLQPQPMLWGQLLPDLLIGLCFTVALLASFAHLGTRKNAWRALGNLRKSWLSREILFTGLFGMSWLLDLLANAFWPHMTVVGWGMASLLGLGLVYSMSQVYRLPAIPGWNTWRTNAGFLVTALLLGQSMMAALMVYESKVNAISAPSSQWVGIGTGLVILLIAQLLLAERKSVHFGTPAVRVGLILMGIGLTAISFFPASSPVPGVTSLLFLILLVEEGIGRWLFYQSRM